MLFTNLSDASEQVDFKTAVMTGLGRNQGLFFPNTIEPIADIDALLEQDFVERSTNILKSLTGDSFTRESLSLLLQKAFNFPLPLVPLQGSMSALELFHGPSLAFKDFGARFLAGCFDQFAGGQVDYFFYANTRRAFPQDELATFDIEQGKVGEYALDAALARQRQRTLG